jgi:hypothetical protein
MLIQTGLTNKLFKAIKKLMHKKTLAIILVIIIVVSVANSLLLISHESLKCFKTNNTDPVFKQLSSIELMLQQAEPKSSDSEQERLSFQQLETNLSSIKTALTSLAKTSDTERIAEQLMHMQIVLNARYDHYDNLLKLLPDKNNNIDASNLPFSVVAIDIIDQTPYVSLNFQDHISPLGVGDKLVDWKLVNADFDENTAVFENAKLQTVRINLNGT